MSAENGQAVAAAQETNTEQTAQIKSEAPVITPEFGVLDRVEKESGVKVSACFQCGKCSNGCPVTFAMDYHPYQVVRFVHLGLKDRLVNSKTVWICATCHTCLTRCPNDVDIPRLMDYLKETISKGEGKVALPDTELFHRQFIKSVKSHGRVFEGGLMQGYFIKSKKIFKIGEMLEYAMLGKKMIQKGRLKFLPSNIKGKKEIKAMFKK